MTKNELAEEVARQLPHHSKRDIEVIVETILARMVSAFVAHHRVELRGFGSFSSRPRRARDGRNPRTGAVVAVPAKWALVFACGKELHARLNGPAASGSAPSGTISDFVQKARHNEG